MIFVSLASWLPIYVYFASASLSVGRFWKQPCPHIALLQGRKHVILFLAPSFRKAHNLALSCRTTERPTGGYLSEHVSVIDAKTRKKCRWELASFGAWKRAWCNSAVLGLGMPVIIIVARGGAGAPELAQEATGPPVANSISCIATCLLSRSPQGKRAR